MGLMGFMGWFAAEVFQSAFDFLVVVAERCVHSANTWVEAAVVGDGARRLLEYGGAAYRVVTGVEAQVCAQLFSGPGEGAAAAAAHEVGARNAPDLADDADDLAGEFVVDVSGGCWHSLMGLMGLMGRMG